MRIYLIGYMGSGKTKTADALSKILNFRFVDTDKLVEEKAGSTVSEIFNREGHEHFREIEKNVLHNTDKSEDIIVATGGGTPCYFDNMQWMNDHGITVYLEANAGLLFHRLAASKRGRPLIEKLNDIELMEQIMGHLAVRIPVYRKAHIIYNAADLNTKKLAEKINEFSKQQSA